MTEREGPLLPPNKNQNQNLNPNPNQIPDQNPPSNKNPPPPPIPFMPSATIGPILSQNTQVDQTKMQMHIYLREMTGWMHKFPEHIKVLRFF